MNSNREWLVEYWIDRIVNHNRPYPEDYTERVYESVASLSDNEVDDYVAVLKTKRQFSE